MAILTSEATENGEEVERSPMEGGQLLECATEMESAQDGDRKMNRQK